MHKKRALVLWGYLSLLALAACGPKVIDDADLVSIDYIYTFSDWTVVEEWNAEFVIGEDNWYQRLEPVIRWAKKDQEFVGILNWKELYAWEYDGKMIQSYSRLVLAEVLGISDPKVGDQVLVNTFWNGVIIKEDVDEEWYPVYLVDFNDPKTYSDLSYSVKINSIEKR